MADRREDNTGSFGPTDGQLAEAGRISGGRALPTAMPGVRQNPYMNRPQGADSIDSSGAFNALVSQAGPMSALAHLLYRSQQMTRGAAQTDSQTVRNAGGLQDSLRMMLGQDPQSMMAPQRQPMQAPGAPLAGAMRPERDYRAIMQQERADRFASNQMDDEETMRRRSMRSMQQQENGEADKQQRATQSFLRLMELIPQLTRGLR